MQARHTPHTGILRHIIAAILLLIATTPVLAADSSDASSTSVSARPPALMPMYAVSFALQGYDAYSTITLVNAGNRELNPVVNAVMKNPPAFAAVKLGAAAATCLLSERLWKTHHRTAAVVLMTASNIGLAIVAANNTLRFRGAP